jgi:hypothetical protein
MSGRWKLRSRTRRRINYLLKELACFDDPISPDDEANLERHVGKLRRAMLYYSFMLQWRKLPPQRW